MEVLKISLVLMIVISLGSARFEIIDNPAALNVFHSDRQSTPVVGPPPKNQTSKDIEIRFHQCAMEFDFKHRELADIIDVYKQVMFGKNYAKECPAGSELNLIHYMGNGKKLIDVKIDYKAVSRQMSPTKFQNVHEKYSILVEKNGRVVIEADYYPGIVRALDTLSQLIERNEDQGNNKEYRIKYTPILIKDEPDYAYRGLMLDTSKEYFNVGDIKLLLDGMMISRLNVFHWHFMDSDSMAMKLNSFPGITNDTAFRSSEVYTSDNVKEITLYAKIRGIKVIPEIQTPANVNVLGNHKPLKDLVRWYSDPSMVSKKNSYPSEAVLDIGNTRSVDFVDKVIKDVLEMFEPEILHLGGDKPNIGCLNHISDPVESLRKYIEKEREILKKYSSDTRAMYWFEDGSFRYNPTDILHYKGNSRQFEYTISSHRENYYVFSPSDIMVVHHGYPDNAGTHRNTGRTESWKRYWDFNPASYNKNGKMLGSEVLVWTEMMNEFEFLPKTFPRAGIVSFKHWNSTPSITSGAVIETIMRLQYRLKSFGVPTEKISMRYCEEHTHHCFGL